MKNRQRTAGGFRNTQGHDQSLLVTLLHQKEAWHINRNFISNLCLLVHRTTNPSVPLFNEAKLANAEHPECAPEHILSIAKSIKIITYWNYWIFWLLQSYYASVSHAYIIVYK
jgi:hypothetical protein